MTAPSLAGSLWTSAFTALAAAVGTLAIRRYAERHLLDVPNSRSSHALPTPRGGGLAIVLSFLAGCVYLFQQDAIALPYTLALAGGLPVAIIGFLDDHGHVAARWRLLVHLAAATWAVLSLGGFEYFDYGGTRYPLGGFGRLLAVFFLVWLVNLFNFMDGIDGIAGGETIALCLGVGLLLGIDAPELSPWLLLASASAGFLVWNWPPARIFLGDVGSGFLGFVLGVMALRAVGTGQMSLVVWLILAGVFYVDTGVTLLRRLWTGQRWYQAHRSHAYQRAAARHRSHRRVTLGVLLIDLLWLLPWAAAAQTWPQWEGAILLLASLPLLLLAAHYDAGGSAREA